MKKILLALGLSLAAQVAHAAPAADPGPVPEGQIKALVACMAADSCGQEAYVQTVDKGVVMYSVSAISTDGYMVECLYVIKDSAMLDFGVAMITTNGAVYIDDANHDGKIDGIASVDGKTTSDVQRVVETDPNYSMYQGLYLATMQLIQEHIVEHASAALSLPAA